MTLRVVAGEAGGRRLVAPKSDARPTSDRAKEALFASLGAERLRDARVLDLYAGSGALGIEALSRGASDAVFVDRDRRAHDAIRANLEATGFTERARVSRLAVDRFLSRPGKEGAFDVVFLDPPYDVAERELVTVLDRLGTTGILAPGATIAVETGKRRPPPPLPHDWRVLWQRAYGDTLLTVATV